jgi:hypothetical protein
VCMPSCLCLCLCVLQVCVWVDWSTHAYVSGDTLAQALHDHDTLNVRGTDVSVYMTCMTYIPTH